MALYDDTGGSHRSVKSEQLNMFTAGGSHARLFCRKGADLRIDMACKLVPFFMPWEHGYGFLQSTYRSFVLKDKKFTNTDEKLTNV